ncbi:hypothetical protein AAZX31_20G019300 [Glycine max]
MIIYLTFPPPASAINLTSVRRNQRLLLCAIAYFTDRAFEHFLICLHVPIFLNLHTVCIFLNQRKSYTLHFMSLNQGFKHPSPSCLLISRKIMDKYDQYCSNYGGRKMGGCLSSKPKAVDNGSASGNTNCFMLYARALSITWGETPEYWIWVQQKEASGTIIELAKLKKVCWLEVRGKFDIRKLLPGILYQVSFLIMLEDSSEGWEVPINVRLVLPGGKRQQHKVNLNEKLRENWMEILVGEFVASEKDGGEMDISMYEYEGGMWKSGLVIQGVVIKPKN